MRPLVRFTIFRRRNSTANFVKQLARPLDPTKMLELDEFTPEKTRNFGIVAHVDHGKSTLADRLMELTGVVASGGVHQKLDTLNVERERGITVKAQTCSMIHQGVLLNLIDTPGHVDFCFEVRRSMAACDGILLLIAANQGIQAQTVANFWLAFEHSLTIIPVINKIDLGTNNVENLQLELASVFDFDTDEIVSISAKNGLHVDRVLDALIHRLDDEYETSVIMTAPNVEFRAKVKDNETIRRKRFEGRAEVGIVDPSMFPDPSDIETFLEPMVLTTLVFPCGYIGPVSALVSEFRGHLQENRLLDNERILLKARLPLADFIVDFFDRLKLLTSGFASLDYDDDGYQQSDLVKLTISLNDRPVDEFSAICPRATVLSRARTVLDRLKVEIPRQQYAVDIKASLGKSSKALVQTRISPMKRDFTGRLKGNFGDPTRLNKLLADQKKGKKAMKSIGRVQIPRRAFINVLRNR